MDSTRTTATLPRRALLALAGSGLGALAVAGLRGGRAEAADSNSTGQAGQAGQANERLVREFCAAWSTLDANRVGAFFADDAVYRVIETAKPTVGRTRSSS